MGRCVCHSGAASLQQLVKEWQRLLRRLLAKGTGFRELYNQGAAAVELRSESGSVWLMLGHLHLQSMLGSVQRLTADADAWSIGTAAQRGGKALEVCSSEWLGVMLVTDALAALDASTAWTMHGWKTWRGESLQPFFVPGKVLLVPADWAEDFWPGHLVERITQRRVRRPGGGPPAGVRRRGPGGHRQGPAALLQPLEDFDGDGSDRSDGEDDAADDPPSAEHDDFMEFEAALAPHLENAEEVNTIAGSSELPQSEAFNPSRAKVEVPPVPRGSIFKFNRWPPKVSHVCFCPN